jgi:hypothetical protein
MLKGIKPVSQETKATVRFYLEIGAIIVACAISWTVLSGKADSAIYRIEKIEVRQGQTDVVLQDMKTDVEVTKNNVQWIRQNMESKK